MSKEQNSTNTIIARWIEGKLTENEQKNFEQSPDFKKYKKILEASEKISIEKVDLDANYKKLQARRNRKNILSKTISLKLFMYGSAAVILVLLGLYMFRTTNLEIHTGVANTKEITLPDGSQVLLNAVSKISYNKDEFLKKRTLYLDGEAYFNVQKGSSFTVTSVNGDVKVLGTQFNVYSRKENFIVFCKEGKVSVTSKNREVILLEGEYSFSKKNTPLSAAQQAIISPTWMTGKTTFQKATLTEVFESLERQFDIEIIPQKIDLNREYHGYFEHKNLKNALLKVCEPMQISYSIKGKKIYLSSGNN